MALVAMSVVSHLSSCRQKPGEARACVVANVSCDGRCMYHAYALIQ